MQLSDGEYDNISQSYMSVKFEYLQVIRYTLLVFVEIIFTCTDVSGTSKTPVLTNEFVFKIKYNVFGNLLPQKCILSDTKNNEFSGRPNRYVGLNGNTGVGSVG